MTRGRGWVLPLALIAAVVAMPLPAAAWDPLAFGLWLVVTVVILVLLNRPMAALPAATLALVGAVAGAVYLALLPAAGTSDAAAVRFLLASFAASALLGRVLERLSAQGRGRAIDLAVPVLFGIWLICLWQFVTVGFAVPSVLLPPPSQIAGVLAGSLGVLGEDFVQTFIRSMVPGYVIGCGAGFLVGVLVDRVPFLQRGLLPVGNLVSALPIVGIAPIMVMWFGFDWQSKAAVVVIMTFFPMLVNTIAGLAALGRIERDLMRTYAASYRQTLLRARLPAALPFIFNALKLNSTLALIGAIVAEFFGTPIVGMGFRISASVGRMDIPLVWATITVAAVAGSAAYGAVALVERSLTFWHPSFRKAS
ncbi:MAG TPA: ABC transporter permease [Stellaceae bacterium]|nr:ABC transporter permease [Stellaceae bacterium]